MIDTHTHLYDESLYRNLDKIIEKAQSKNITKFCMPNIDISSLDKMLSIV